MGPGKERAFCGEPTSRSLSPTKVPSLCSPRRRLAILGALPLLGMLLPLASAQLGERRPTTQNVRAITPYTAALAPGQFRVAFRGVDVRQYSHGLVDHG